MSLWIAKGLMALSAVLLCHGIPSSVRKVNKPDFSVVLFRPHCMLLSEEHPMKSHKKQWLVSLLSPLISLVELRTRGHTMVTGLQTPSQCPNTGLSPEKCAYKSLRIKHFHGVSAGDQHPYLLKSRYGKVREKEGIDC